MTTAGVTTDTGFAPTDGADNPSARTAEVFHFLGPDTDKNITAIVQRALPIIGGVFSVYLDTTGASPRVRASARLPGELAEAIISTPTCFTNIPSDEELIVFDDHTPFPGLNAALAEKFGLTSLLGAVLRKNRRVIGILWVADSRPRVYSSDQIHALHCLGSALAVQAAGNGKGGLEKIGEMAGQLAHDLNNVLTGLVSYPELVLMQLDKDSPLTDPISFMHESGILASDMVQDFLLLARPQTYDAPDLNPVDMVRAYFASSTHARFRHDHPHIQFSMEADRAAGCIRISEILMTKLVTTLLAHASAKIRESTRVDITISVHGRPERGRRDVILAFRDNGVTVPDDDLVRLFDPFYAKKQMGYPGSGLGLTAVQKIMADHGGKVLAANIDDGGFQFSLFFPGADAPGSQG